MADKAQGNEDERPDPTSAPKAAAGKQKREVKLTKAEIKKASLDAFELVRLRNFFYRDNYRRLVLLALFLSFIIFCLCVSVYYLYKNRPAPRYFATNIQGQILPLVPLDKPSLSEAELLSWVQRATTAALTMNYVEYREQLQRAIDTYFTPAAGEDYLKGLDAAQFIGTVKANGYVVTAVANQAPTVESQGVWAAVGNQLDKYAGLYYWKIKMPVTRTYHTPNKTGINEKLEVLLIIVRSSMGVDQSAKNLDGARGIGIGQIVISSLTQRLS